MVCFVSGHTHVAALTPSGSLITSYKPIVTVNRISSKANNKLQMMRLKLRITIDGMELSLLSCVSNQLQSLNILSRKRFQMSKSNN